MVNFATSVETIDDITRQARQGSVAAVIQILNEQLADLGVRVRAVLDHGLLQILCEAVSPEQLEQNHLVAQIRETLEFISPRKIHRIKINARTVREQQLLWLEEIKKDPEGQLLWSQMLILRRPALIRRWLEDLKIQAAISARTDFSKAMPRPKQNRYHFWQGIAGGVGVSALLVVGGWIAYDRLTASRATPSGSTPSGSVPSGSQSNQVQASTVSNLEKTNLGNKIAQSLPTPGKPAKEDTFAQAIRLAETAASNGQAAKSSADWLKLASQWQQAADFMAQVPAQDHRHRKAKAQADFYRRNSQLALQKAQKLRSAQ